MVKSSSILHVLKQFKFDDYLNPGRSVLTGCGCMTTLWINSQNFRTTINFSTHISIRDKNLSFLGLKYSMCEKQLLPVARGGF